MAPLLALALSSALVAPHDGGEAFHEGIFAEITYLEGARSRSEAVAWYRAAGGDRSRLHVIDLKCDQPVGRRQCWFTLVRDGGPVELQDSMVPDRLSCSARFRHNFMRIPSPWLVERRTNMARAGAVATTLRCQAG